MFSGYDLMVTWYRDDASPTFLTRIGEEDWNAPEKTPILSFESTTNRTLTPEVFLGEADAYPPLWNEGGLVSEEQFPEAETFFWGLINQPWVTLPVKKRSQDTMVLPTTFLLNTGNITNWKQGSPMTAVQREVFQILDISQKPLIGRDYYSNILGVSCETFMSNPDSVYKNINILGTDVIWNLDLQIKFKEIFTLTRVQPNRRRNDK